MKTLFLRLSLGLIIAFTLSSCSSIRVSYYGNNEEKIKSIALISTMVGKVEQSPLPLIDAAIFNGKLNKIADDIFEMEIRNVDKLRNRYAESLNTNFKAKVLFGDSLYKSSEYAQLQKKMNSKRSLDTNSERFPYIIIPKNEFNPFQFEKANVSAYFNESGKNYTQTVSEIATKLNTDLVAVSYSYITTGAGNFGINGAAQGVTYLYLFDKKGNLISSSSNFSKGTIVSGSDVNQFNDEFDNLLGIVEPMMNKVIDKFLNPKK